MLLFFCFTIIKMHSSVSSFFNRSVLLLIVIFSTINLHAQITFSDSLRISLLTASPGVGAYERFGHTAFRIQDLSDGKDIVFHYGVYNYNEPNFIMHFVQGICNYKIGANYSESFIADYRHRRIRLIEQELNFNKNQKSRLVDALIENYRPENRDYRYNFFFDNCATRPFDMINQYAGPVVYDTLWVTDKTLRDMIQEKTMKGNWLDFGISLAVAGRADQKTTFREQMFLPDYLSIALDNASIDGLPLVNSTHELTPYGNDISSALHDNGPWYLSPLAASCLFLILSLVVTLANFRSKKRTVVSRVFDSTWLLLTGLTGVILWFLNFFSEHPSVNNNLNCLLFLPTNLLFIVIIWLKKAEKVCRIYFFIIFAAVLLYIIVHATMTQYLNPAFIPIALAIIIRCIK